MICDLSSVAGRDPLHVNKPAAAVVAHPWYVWLTTNPQHTFPPHPLPTAPTTTGMCG